MKFLIDTQILIWFNLDNGKLKQRILDLITNPTNIVYVSQISLFEIAVKQNVGKLSDLDWDTFTIKKQLEKDGFQFLNIENKHIQRYISLTKFDSHRDPFDRLLISTAISERLTVISADEKFKLYKSEIELIEA
ncbi:MAG: type II toxin-antitoxin system VapC family toxin [Leadbetterella sp.]|nr:type II toxin-antitoxin system VapC family toxin [Leadbetterella sp.]MBP8155895.1 type II toxin-antitoxin system VapC family toxin [Leadbetterella sp.]